MRRGLTLANQEVVEARALAEEPLKAAMSGFQIASRAGTAAATWNIAVLYERGAGVTQSRLAAAEWYARAGVQYQKAGVREQALAALERVEAIDPQHPDGKSLRADLYPPKAKITTSRPPAIRTGSAASAAR
jgi:TPR repeat protein